MIRVVRRFAILLALASLAGLAACDKIIGSDPAPEESDKKVAEAGDSAAPEADSGDDEGGEDSGDEPEIEGGPEIAWETAMAVQPRTLRISNQGVVVFVFEDRMEGFRDKSKVWSKKGNFTELVRLVDGSFVGASGPKLEAFDPNTGETKFEFEVPGPESDGPPKKKGDDSPPPGIVGAATFGSQVLLAMADARFFVADPPACAAKEPACTRPAGFLPGEYLEPAAVLTVSDSGTRILAEDDTMRAFDLALELEFDLEAHANIVGATPVAEKGLALAFGGEIAFLDIESCRGKGTVKLAKRGFTVAAKGCVAWRYGSGLDDVAPAVIDSETLAANGNQRLQAIVAGSDSWKTPIGSMGRVIRGNDGLLYTMASDESEDATTVSVKAVHPERGVVVWEVGLPFVLESGAVVVTDSLAFDWQGTWIAAGLDNNLAVLRIPGPTPPDEGTVKVKVEAPPADDETKADEPEVPPAEG
jgi:hypothetical protein